MIAIGIGCYVKRKTQQKAIKDELELERLKDMKNFSAEKVEDLWAPSPPPNQSMVALKAQLGIMRECNENEKQKKR